jgi:hypothetical protein
LFYLLKVDPPDEKQIITTMITVKYKSDKTTAATAIAIHDVTPSYQNNTEQQKEIHIGKAIFK